MSNLLSCWRAVRYLVPMLRLEPNHCVHPGFLLQPNVHSPLWNNKICSDTLRTLNYTWLLDDFIRNISIFSFSGHDHSHTHRHTRKLDCMCFLSHVQTRTITIFEKNLMPATNGFLLLLETYRPSKWQKPMRKLWLLFLQITWCATDLLQV